MALIAGVFAVVAVADAPDSTNTINYSNLGFAPNQASVVSVTYDPNGLGGLGTTTLTVTGGWAWATHGTDCNTDRAGAGYAIAWSDPNDAGYPIGSTGISVGSQNPHGFAANKDANVVQPTPSMNDPANPAALRTVASPSDFLNWGSGCGKVSTGTITGWNSPGSPPTSFSQGYWGPIAHTYAGLPTDLPKKVCAVTYDVHKGSTPTAHVDGLGIPSKAKEITAGGANYNTDNGVESNGSTPAGNQCAEILVPRIAVSKTADHASPVSAGDQIGFTVEVKNTGAGAATNASLSDALPAGSGTGVTWSVDNSVGTPAKFVLSGAQGSQTLGLASSTLPAGADYTVHMTAQTSSSECGTYNNSATLSATNAAPSGPASATESCNTADIHIVKTADAAQVNAGEQIGFTLTVYNSGAGNAKGVSLSDVLPVKAGLNWSIASQGSGWGGTCAIAAGSLNCGPKTVAGSTTQAGSTFTVHITSPTTTATGGVCPSGSGVVDNTGNVTTTNDGSDQSSASTCVAAPDIQIDKTADAAQVNAGEQIGFTLTVWNTGAGAAKGVTLSDPLPVKTGLNWSIAGQGSGWGGSCAITAGTLTCGPVTVPAGTTQAGSTFTVHITSTTTTATGGVCPDGSGTIDNTGSVTTTNDGTDESSASTCVAAPDIEIVKTADAAQVNAGEQIGFTLTVYNTGSGNATGVNLSDPLPTNAGLNWTIAHQGAGWSGTCAITAGTLNCGPVTVPAGTTQAGSTFTVHITSPTTPETGGVCPTTGVVDNTGSVTTTNDGSDESSDSVCVVALADLEITKVGSPASQDVLAGAPYQDVTWTMVVKNNGPAVDTNVTVGDPIPTGSTYVSSSTTKGTCAGGAVLNCSLGTLQVGETVTITLVTTPTQEGQLLNTATVVGDLAETTLTNNTASASVIVATHHVLYCTAAVVRPKQLYVGRKTLLHVTVVSNHSAVKGVRVRITGPGFKITTKRSNAKGQITQVIVPQKAGIVIFRPLATKSCKTPRVGITGVFTPPVTG